MDRAYEGDETKQLVLPALGVRRALYKKRNEIEWILRKLKGFRRIFYRFEKT
jgi:hypothetical protein